MSTEVKEVAPHLWKTDRGTLELRLVGPGVAIVRCVGFMEAVLLPPLFAAVRAAVAPELRLHLFFDGDEVDGYETQFRVGMTEWLRGQKDRLAPGQVLVRSKLVAMGASIASLALGGFLRIHNQRAVFEGLIQTALRSAKEL